MASSFLMFLDHTQRRTTVGRTSLDEWSARRRDLLPDNTQHSQQTNIHAPGGIRTHDLSRRAAADLRPRPRGHWDRPSSYLTAQNQVIQSDLMKGKVVDDGIFCDMTSYILMGRYLPFGETCLLFKERRLVKFDGWGNFRRVRDIAKSDY